MGTQLTTVQSRYKPVILKSLQAGFALPTVLIVATVMLMVLLVAVQASVSVSQSLDTQYKDKISKEAAESGIAMAKACLAAAIPVNTIGWTDLRQLKPNSDCTGADLITTCPSSSTNASCYVLNTASFRTKFLVGVTISGSPATTEITSQGIADEIRKTSGTPVNRLTYTIRLNVSDLVNQRTY